MRVTRWTRPTVQAITHLFVAACLLAAAAYSAPGQTAAPGNNALYHGRHSEGVEPFRIVGNIYYVGARNIASYLITTPKGHILIDSGTREMHNVVLSSVEKLGFKVRDIKILLCGHTHFDHVQGHAAMQKATGAKVMAMREDALALMAGMDLSPIADEGWDPVKVDRVLKDGDTVTLGGTTLRALWTPGHTPGCTTWTTTVQEKDRPYSVFIGSCVTGPNAWVKLIGNPKFPDLAEQAQRTFQILKTMKPDIYLLENPESEFAGKIERMKAGERPHPLLGPEAFTKLVTDVEANFHMRLQEERAKEATSK
jgi:metallo-beta-lactamase class B